MYNIFLIFIWKGGPTGSERYEGYQDDDSEEGMNLKEKTSRRNHWKIKVSTAEWGVLQRGECPLPMTAQPLVHCNINF